MPSNVEGELRVESGMTLALLLARGVTLLTVSSIQLLGGAAIDGHQFRHRLDPAIPLAIME